LGSSQNTDTVNANIALTNTGLDIDNTYSNAGTGGITIGTLGATTILNNGSATQNINFLGLEKAGSGTTINSDIGTSGAAITLADKTDTATTVIAGALGADVTSVTVNTTNGASLILSGTNTNYDGSTLLSTGTLQLGTATALGGNGTTTGTGGTLTIAAGATLDASATTTISTVNGETWNGNFSFGGSHTLNTGTGAVSLGANVQLTNAGGSTLTVGGSVSGSGNLTLVTSGAGGLTFTGGLTGTDNLVLNANSTGSITFSTTAVNNSGTITNSGSSSGTTTIGGGLGSSVSGVTENSSASALILSGTDTSYDGATLLSVGTLKLGSATALGGNGSTSGAGGTLTIAAGTTLDASAATVISTVNAETWNGNFTFGGSNALNTGTGAVSLGANVQLTNAGANTLTVGGAVSGSANLTLVNSGAGGLTFAGTSINNGGTITNSGGGAGSTTISGALGSSVSGITQNSSTSALILSGTNTNFAGTLTISAGTLQVSGTGTLGSVGTIADNGTLEYSSSVNQTLASAISGTGALTKDTSTTSTLVLSAANSYSGETTLNAGTLQLQNANAIGSLNLTPAGAMTLSLNADSNTTFNAASVNFSGSGATYNFNVNNITSAGAGNTLILTNLGQFGTGGAGTDTFDLTGGTNRDTLQLGSGSSGSGALSFYNNTTINSNTAGVTLSIPGGLAENASNNLPYTLIFGGAGNITIGAITNNGNVSGVLTPTFSGSGTIVLTGSNSFDGATATISTSGSLLLNNANALTGINAITISGTVTLDNITGSSITLSANPAQSWSNNFTFGGTNALNLGTGAVTMSASRTVTVNGTGALTVGGVIGQAASGYGLTKAGSGTLVLTASNSYTGGTAIAGNGNLNLVFSQGGATTNIINPMSGLTLGGSTGGGTLTVTGGSGAANTQTFATLAFGAGASQINYTPGTFGGSVGVAFAGALSAPSATLHGTVQFGTGGITTMAGNLGSAILLNAQGNAYATYGTDDWAATNGTTGAVQAATYTSTGTIGFTGGVINTVTGSFNSGNTSVTAIRFASTTGYTVSEVSGDTLTTGGILVASTAVASAINGSSGFIRNTRSTASNNYDFDIIQNSSSDFTIGANVANASSSTTTLVNRGQGG
jgi:fibronectin-binding autotransporter adhesin